MIKTDSLFEVREVKPEERAGALALCADVFMKFEAPVYPKEGTEHFLAFLKSESEKPSLTMYAAFTDGKIIGVLATRNEGTHISLFFVDEQYHRQGAGRALFDFMLKETSPEKLTVHSSPYAANVYKKLGFTPLSGEEVQDGIRYIPMMYEKKRGNGMTQVVAALIWNKNRFMICQRPKHKTRGLLWEFVGGKVEEGESKQQALVRECIEELDITVTVGDPFIEVIHEYPDMTVDLTLFHCEIAEGKPKMLEHNDIRWITPDEIDGFAFCPADREILDRIKREWK
ncbi:MAG: GNAT family N-acetyltransferase [Acutalibacteraceae bacterium]